MGNGTKTGTKLEKRVVAAADAALRDHQYVTALDVLQGLGWLAPSSVDQWRQGRVDYLERVVTANLKKISTAMRVLRRWAASRDLKPSETCLTFPQNCGSPARHVCLSGAISGRGPGISQIGQGRRGAAI
jgi:hypothetical protein